MAIKNLNFCVEPSECFGLLGLNGAGKTTTFKCITQELSPSNGAIYINGKDTSNNFDEIKSLMGYCPQYEAIFEYMTVYENLEFYARIKGVKLELLDQLVNAMIIEMASNNTEHLMLAAIELHIKKDNPFFKSNKTIFHTKL